LLLVLKSRLDAWAAVLTSPTTIDSDLRLRVAPSKATEIRW
jgi:hypothetical protein